MNKLLHVQQQLASLIDHLTFFQLRKRIQVACFSLISTHISAHGTEKICAYKLDAQIVNPNH
jgi:hypothetical protein